MDGDVGGDILECSVSNGRRNGGQEGNLSQIVASVERFGTYRRYLAGDGDRGEMSAITECFSGDGCDGVGDNRISAAGDKGVGRGIDDGIAVFAAVVMSVVGIDGHGD